ncbi:MAG: O-antigen polymerase [Verrucomicrobiales bacterium]|nr:O-antigen polymerase [Verrucomicrobiales bacterium]
MPPKLALLFCTVFVVFAFRWDQKRGATASKDLFWPSLWYMIVASKPIGVWLDLWGVPLPGGGGDATDGSIIDRLFYGILTVIGLRILSRRRFDWVAALRNNQWLTVFVAFMALSILWSQYPFVSLKRFVKVLGSIVMACVVLTEPDPLNAFTTVLRRCLYIHLPMSILCTRYFRDIGVSFDWGGTTSAWRGISTSKNTLGQIAMLGVVCFFWEVRQHWQQYKWRNLHMVYLLMAAYLLKGAGSISMTSVSVCVFALAIFLRIQALRDQPQAVGGFVKAVFIGLAALIVLVLTHSVVHFSQDSLFGKMITTFGRDITLTDRTFIWSDVYGAAAGKSLCGVGFGGFWIGRLANIPWNEKMTWVLGQAHSGYVDTYLQLGLVGGFLLAIVLFNSVPRLLASLADDFDFGCFRITLFLTIMFINITESTYLRGDHHLWLIFMIVLWKVPKPLEMATDPLTETRENHSGSDRIDGNCVPEIDGQPAGGRDQ